MTAQHIPGGYPRTSSFCGVPEKEDPGRAGAWPFGRQEIKEDDSYYGRIGSAGGA
ncbi:MAG: hypothetical protein IJ899_13545 [Blautia sp.]|nr:hypothetical protein [Blautia sp.]